MAENTAMRNNALPYPIYGAPWTVVFVIRDADGDPVSPSSPDSEISKNGDTAVDVNPGEAAEISGLTGFCTLSLSATEMTADVVAIEVNSTGGKTPGIVLYPRKLVTIRSGTSASGGASTSTIVLDASASAVDDYYNGMVCIATIDGNVEARVISDYVGSTQTCTVVPDWNVAPDNNDTFVIKLPEGVQVNQANTTAWNGAAVASPHTAGYPVVTIKDGTGTGEIDTTSGGVLVAALAANTITATSIASDAFTAAKFASDVTTEFQSGLATASALATVEGKIDTIDDFLDTEITAILADTNELQTDWTDGGRLDLLIDAIKTKTDLVPGTQDGKTFAELVLLMAAAILGKASGLETTTAVYRSVDDTVDRITATVDADGNRSAVTYDTSSP